MLDQSLSPMLYKSNKYSNSSTELSNFKFSAIPQLGITPKKGPVLGKIPASKIHYSPDCGSSLLEQNGQDLAITF